MRIRRLVKYLEAGRAGMFSTDSLQARMGLALANRPSAQGSTRLAAALNDMPDTCTQEYDGVFGPLLCGHDSLRLVYTSRIDTTYSDNARGKVIAIVGNSGVGKTTLVNALCRIVPFIAAQEQHSERPFQALMKDNPHRYALANQVDYLLYRAEQEQAIRQSGSLGLVDGGLDLDFYGFTQLFHYKGYLTDAEFALCQRLYTQLRAALGPPDLIVRLVAPTEVVTERYARRGRVLEIAEHDDLAMLGALVDTWLDSLATDYVMIVDVSADEPIEDTRLKLILNDILSRLEH